MNTTFEPDEESNSQLLTDEEWAAIPRLPDPIEATPESNERVSLEDLHSHITRQDSVVGRRRSLALVAAAAIVGGAVVLWPGGSTPSASAAVQDAISNTVEFDSGRMMVEQTYDAGERQLDQNITVEFSGADFRIVFDNNGSIVVGGEGAFTPEHMEVRQVEGSAFITVNDEGWFPAEARPGSESLDDIGARVLAATDAAQDLDRCDPSAEGLDAYCFSTTDTGLIEALRPASLVTFLSLDADVRVEIDSASQTLHRISIEATDVIVDPASQPQGLVVADGSLSSTTTFHDLGQPVTIQKPTDLTEIDASSPAEGFNESELPLECQGLHPGDEVVECLTGHGHTMLAEYYAASLD